MIKILRRAISSMETKFSDFYKGEPDGLTFRDLAAILAPYVIVPGIEHLLWKTGISHSVALGAALLLCGLFAAVIGRAKARSAPFLLSVCALSAGIFLITKFFGT